MGYFSNGSEGADYEARYCNRCVHQDDDGEDAEGCPVWVIHHAYNYAQLKNNDLKVAMFGPIPQDEAELRNLQCKMFHGKQSEDENGLHEEDGPPEEATDEEKENRNPLRFAGT